MEEDNGIIQIDQDKDEGLKDPGRREILKIMGGLTFFALFGTAAVYRKMKNTKQRVEETLNRTKKEISSLQEDEQKPEILNFDKVVPECARTAEDVLITVPYYSSVGTSFAEAIPEYFGLFYNPMLKALPQYSKIHIVCSDEMDEKIASKIKEMHPGREMFFYPIFNCDGTGGMYAQDIGKALGNKDGNNQFEFISPMEEWRSLRGQSKCKMFSNERLQVKTNPMFIDNLLAKKYPDKFKLKYLDATFVGGNMIFGYLPNGEKCIYVGKDELAFFMYCTLGYDISVPISSEDYQAAKKRYAQAFGTDNLIVIDEEHFREGLKEKSLQEVAHPGAFFHIDMVFSEHLIKGEPKIFMSSYRETEEVLGNSTIDIVKGESYYYLQRVNKQMRDLGFEVIDIPFFSNDINFVNVIPFTDKINSKPKIILPYYHDEERRTGYLSEYANERYLSLLYESAYEKYQSEGVDIISASYAERNSEVTSLKSANVSAGTKGSFHCRMQVLS